MLPKLSASSGLVLENRPSTYGNGGIKVSASLVALARNNWLEVEQTVSEISIKLGRNARELRSPEERKRG